MEFIKDNYRLTLKKDYDGIDINLHELIDLENSNPLIYLNLKPLNEIDTQFDDATITRDIPRNLFIEGDYYQSSVTKYAKDIYLDKSLLSIIHIIIIENKQSLPLIKSIYSSSLNFYKEEIFISPNAIHFWNIQLSKSNEIPISYYKKDKRYLLKIND